ncbi:hypothetical protein D3Y57_14385 [Sphingomonas paeninsulae]|uniref:Uncharacterized protein n=1 Tax=Sphingomonas paeninsulae TaxID=2319844 RepID=A0A494TM82_SPHPE|nr:hypothetical protein [Sphingomonas paeninsulae]AYJ86911.1 hypothetical protein D3Y57_14385 [Sphingomonas paeninsulae]
MTVGQPTLLSDWELWACAVAMERQHGAKADEAVAQRVTELALAGDYDGVTNWKIIASRLDQLKYPAARRC